MPYDELEHCLEAGQEPFWGPLSWLAVACAFGVGFTGYVALGAFGALLGALLGLALSMRYRGVSGAQRLLLLLRARRAGMVELGAVEKDPIVGSFQVRRMVKGQPTVIIKRGRL